MEHPHIVCNRCICDSRIPGIRFDAEGECNFCKMNDALEKEFPLGEAGRKNFTNLIGKIKRVGHGHEYDCIVGVSGGRDSSYTLYVAVNNGLRPLAVHFDDGWNSETATSNIKRITKTWGSTCTRSSQIGRNSGTSKSLASADGGVPDGTPFILSTLYKAAKDFDVRYILNGHSFRTEGLSPLRWTYMDGRYVRSVHARFSRVPLKSFPILSLADLAYSTIVKGIRTIPLLSYLEYTQQVTKIERDRLAILWGPSLRVCLYEVLSSPISVPTKFNIDERVDRILHA